jgi:prepilin-type N-terminal cleavage/methylation domain-containing protein
MRRAAGFTLLELIAVIAIVGLIAALAIGRMDFFIPKYRLRGAAREVGSVLKQAKAKAAAAGRDVYFQADLQQGEYWLLVPFPKLKEDGSLPGPDDPVVYEYQEALRNRLPKGVECTEVILGPDAKMTSGKATVRFSPFGASQSVIVNLQMDERLMCTKLNGITGVVTFYEEHQKADELLEAPSD